MTQRVKPKGKALQSLVNEYRATDHKGKLSICEKFGISYDTLRNWINQGIKPLPPEPEHFQSVSWEDHLRIFREMDSLTKRHEFVPSEITLKIDTTLPFIVCFSADWQLGEYGVDYDAFEADVNKWCQTKNFGVMVGGDGYQNIIEAKKIGSSHNQIPICNQRALYVLTLNKLQDAGVLSAIGTGNHNYWSALATGEDWDSQLAHRLREKNPKLVYTKHGGMIYLQVGQMVYPIWREHSGPFESTFNPTHGPRQSQRMQHPDARIVVREHKHQGEITQYRYNNQECIAIRTGTYAVRDDFAERIGYYGASVCNPAVVLYPNEDKMLPFKDYRDAIKHLL